MICHFWIGNGSFSNDHSTASQQSLATTVSKQLKAAHTACVTIITWRSVPLRSHSYLARLCVVRKCCFPVGFLFQPSPKLAFLAPSLFHRTPAPVSSTFSFIQLLVTRRDERIEGSKRGEDPTDNTVENLITIWEDKDHLKMLAWLAEIAISRRRIENRIFSEFMAAFVSACLAIRKGSGDRAAAAYGSFVRNWHRALYVSSHYKTTKQPTNNKQQTNQTIDNWQASLSTCRHVPSKDYVSLHKLHSPIDKTM